MITREHEVDLLSMQRNGILSRIKLIDSMLDDDSISDGRFSELSRLAARLQADEGKIYQRMEFLSGEELVKVSAWLEKFLGSFGCGTRKITIKQAQVFLEIPFDYVGGLKVFWFRDRRFSVESPNYRTGFSYLNVSMR